MRKLLVLLVTSLLALTAAASPALGDPPTLELPGTIVAEAENAAGATVSFTVSATNSGGNPVEVSCSHASGSVFAIGDTTVTCTAGDEEPVTGSFLVSVRDTTGPAVSALGDAVVEAAGPAGSVVAFEPPTATDAVDGPLPTSCSPPSGSTFALGATVVTCSATDTRGNAGSSSFSVTVRDTTAPTLSAPAAIALTTTDAAGLAATAPAIQTFLASATATDLVTPAPSITHNGPAIFAPGVTEVTFTARDAAGNVATATSTVTITRLPTGSPPPPPPAPPPPPPPAPAPPPPPPPVGAAPDRTPPRNVSGVTARAGDRSVFLTWRRPTDDDFAGVVIRRARQSIGGLGIVVYDGPASAFADRRLTNGIRYRYVIASYDGERNVASGVAVTASPKAEVLLAPADGALVTRAPTLRWRASSRTAYYNVQLFRDGRKILSAWPQRPSLALRRSWTYGGRRYSLGPGVYTWFVWPGIGPQSQARYGALLGQRTFTIR